MSEPHAAVRREPSSSGLLAPPSEDEDIPESHPHINTSRVCIHIDMDYFYCQVKIRDLGLDPTIPVAIKQKYIVVTCNYPARALGVTKLQRITDACKACPELVLVDGSDLRPFREANAAVMQSIRSCTLSPVQKLVFDEFFLDVTAEVARVPSSSSSEDVIAAALRNFDPPLRACDASRRDVALLAAGDALAKRIRDTIFHDTGLTCSAGVSYSKMLAKIASGIRKPNGQTALWIAGVDARVRTIPVRKLPGLGRRAGKALVALGVATAADVRAMMREELVEAIGEEKTVLVLDVANGVDNAPVRDSGASKVLTTEDSFLPNASSGHAREVLRRLAEVMSDRIVTRGEMGQRVPGRDIHPKARASVVRRGILRRSEAALARALGLPALPSPGTPLPRELNLLGVGLTNFRDFGGIEAAFAAAPSRPCPEDDGGRGKDGASDSTGGGGHELRRARPPSSASRADAHRDELCRVRSASHTNPTASQLDDISQGSASRREPSPRGHRLRPESQGSAALDGAGRPAAPARLTPCMFITCTTCGAQVPTPLYQEHADHHIAAELDRKLNAARAPSLGRPATDARGPRKRARPASGARIERYFARAPK